MTLEPSLSTGGRHVTAPNHLPYSTTGAGCEAVAGPELQRITLMLNQPLAAYYPRIPRRHAWNTSHTWLAILGGVSAALAGCAIVAVFVVAGGP